MDEQVNPPQAQQPEQPDANQTPATPESPFQNVEPAAPAAVPTPAPTSVTPAPQEATPAAQAATPAPAAAAAAPKKELTPEEKKAAKKKALKQVGMALGGLYLLVILAIVIWGFAVGDNPLGLFNSLPFSQNGFNRFLMKVFNIFMLIGVLGSLGLTLFLLFKTTKVDKAQAELRKKASRKALFAGAGFFGYTVIWLVLLIMLNPVLNKEELFVSPILTNPEDTFGLTAPVEIVFDASALPIPSSYRVVNYTWNFGDGSNGNGELVAHRYTSKGSADGRYTVVLNVEYMDVKTGELFEDEFTHEVGIANELVAAAFTASPKSGDVPLDVTFDASASIDPDGSIVAYEWDFDADGRFDDAEGVRVEHTFQQEGEYEVSLRVTDSNGEFDIVSDTIEAGSTGGMTPVIQADLPAGQAYKVGEKYTFSGENSVIKSGAITKYTWNFGDGTEVQSRTASHTYDEPGYYTITLTIQDAQGNDSEATLDVEVTQDGSIPLPVIKTTPALESGSVAGAVPLTVVFDATGSLDPDDDIVEYIWDFGVPGVDTETGDRVSYTYLETGAYPAKLTAVDSQGNEASETIEVIVGDQGIQARLDVNLTNGEVPLTVEFDAAASTYREGNIVSYEWDFGTGSDPYVGGSGITFKYNEVGNFTASVTVVADDGSRDTAEVLVVVRPVSLSACFTTNLADGPAPLFVNVDPSCSQGTISSYSWDFGDGDVSFDRRPETHTYTQSGVYNIQLEVTSEEGVVDTFEKTITVN